MLKYYSLDKINDMNKEQRLNGSTPTPTDHGEGSQMVPKMEGSPTEQIKLEHQVPQSQNTSLGSGHDSLSLGAVPTESPITSQTQPNTGLNPQLNPAALSNAAMTSLPTSMSSQYPPYYGQNDFYSNQLGLQGLTHLQTELEKKKRDSPGAYQSVGSSSSQIASNFAGKKPAHFSLKSFFIQNRIFYAEFSPLTKYLFDTKIFDINLKKNYYCKTQKMSLLDIKSLFFIIFLMLVFDA